MKGDAKKRKVRFKTFHYDPIPAFYLETTGLFKNKQNLNGKFHNDRKEGPEQ